MNKEGYISSTAALSLLLVTAFMLASFYTSMYTTNVAIKSSEPPITDYMEIRKATERVYGEFAKDYDRTEPVVYTFQSGDGGQSNVTIHIEDMVVEGVPVSDRVVELTTTQEKNGNEKEVGKQTVRLKKVDTPFRVEVTKLNTNTE